MMRATFACAYFLTACGASAAPAASPSEPPASPIASVAPVAPGPPPASTGTHYVAVMDFTDAGPTGGGSGPPSSFGGLSGVSPSPAATGSGPTQQKLQVSGRLTSSSVAQVLADHHGDFAVCGARMNAAAGDLVAVKFVIDTKGQVKSSTDGGSKTSNANLVACVARLVLKLSFKAPDAGEVTVIDPMVF